jgi:hypothetical protein
MKYTIIIIAIFSLLSCSSDRQDLTTPSLQNDPIDANDIILTSAPDSVLADGRTFGEVQLKVSSKISSKYKDVTFQISPIGKFNNDSGTLKFTLDINGEARVFVKSDVAGIAYVKSLIGNISKIVTVKFYKNSFDTLKIFLGSNNIPADNYSYAEIIALTNNLNPVNRSITFVADKGLFSNNNSTYTLQAGANDTTRAFLKYNKAEIVRVTATVAGTYSKEIFINFVTAFPTQILVEPDSAVLTRTYTAKTKITSRLLRAFGFATEGQVVHFYDSTASTPLRSIGIFLNSTISNSSGTATAEYRLQDITYSGFVYIKSYVETPGGRVYGGNIILIQ